jgi:hypothetical protein
MSVVSNSINYATPSYSGIETESFVDDSKYFSLHDNFLDGTFKVLGSSTPLWSATLSDSTGVFATEILITVTGVTSIHALHVKGDTGNDVYPVDFTVTLYNGATQLYQQVVTDNVDVDWLLPLTQVYDVTSYTVSVTKINKANYTMRLNSVYNTHMIIRAETLTVRQDSSTSISLLLQKTSNDVLSVVVETNDLVTVLLNDTDTLISNLEIEAAPTNIHSVMRDASRRVYGKVMISYMNPLLDMNFTTATNGVAYNTSVESLLDGAKEVTNKYFMLYDNVLSDSSFKLIGDDSKTGWWSSELSQVYCGFEEDPTLTVSFSPRFIQSLSISSSRLMDILLVDFTVRVVSNGDTVVYDFVDNEDYECLVTNVPLVEVTQIEIAVHTINKPFTPANITEITLSSIMWYEQEDIISMDLLEELTYNDGVESLGGVSSNELTLLLTNTDGQFYFNNNDSLIAKQLKKNRRILPYLGVYIGELLEWYPLGVFWSYNWDVPVRGLHAKVTAFDTLGLLNTTPFLNHQVYINHSMGQLAEIVLLDAKTQYSELEWLIDDELYNVIIPYAWFKYGMHMAALERLARCARINIYCDRLGRIIVRQRYKYTGTKYDTWTDDTNVTSKTYPTLNTVVPNNINVYLTQIRIQNMSISSDTSTFSVTEHNIKMITSENPIVSNFVLSITADATVAYTYQVFSWGCIITFTGTGNVTAINAAADCIEATQNTMITRKNDNDILLNGAVTTEIRSDFIQKEDFAKALAEEILADALLDIYDTDIEYRGNIALTPNDPIELLDGIAPTTNYFIKRHELSWDGSLHGKAKLNT